MHMHLSTFCPIPRRWETRSDRQYRLSYCDNDVGVGTGTRMQFHFSLRRRFPKNLVAIGRLEKIMIPTCPNHWPGSSLTPDCVRVHKTRAKHDAGPIHFFSLIFPLFSKYLQFENAQPFPWWIPRLIIFSTQFFENLNKKKNKNSHRLFIFGRISVPGIGI